MLVWRSGRPARLIPSGSTEGDQHSLLLRQRWAVCLGSGETQADPEVSEQPRRRRGVVRSSPIGSCMVICPDPGGSRGPVEAGGSGAGHTRWDYAAHCSERRASTSAVREGRQTRRYSETSSGCREPTFLHM